MTDSNAPSEKRFDLEIGLVAIGCGIAWNVQIDETIADPRRWFMQIEGSKDYLAFEIESPNVVDSWLSILESMSGAPKTVDRIEAGHMR
jgi:hypothetical protein